MKRLKIFIIAGEVSGDVLGAKIMRELPTAEFAGIGGDNMTAAGLNSIFPISDLAVMGFAEVLAKAKTLVRRINETVAEIKQFQPDIVLTIDSPSFATRVIKGCKKSHISCQFYHVVAPQVWAWGAWRAKKYARLFDRLYCFFDFEKKYFTKYGLETISVGHPIADGLSESKNKIGAVKNIALLPGSRISEVKKLLPVYHELLDSLAAQKYNYFIPITETTKNFIKDEIKTWDICPALVPFDDRYKLFNKTDIAIAASGTVSAELAIMHVPAVVVYRMNPLTMMLARMVVKTKWVSLVNILLQKTVYPELLGDKDATAPKITNEIKKLARPDARRKMIIKLSAADKMWHRGRPAAKLIAESIKKS